MGIYDGKKQIRLSIHAHAQCIERGTTKEEIKKAISEGSWLAAKNNKLECKIALPYNGTWNGRFFLHKEVRPIFVEETDEIVVITVYTYYN